MSLYADKILDAQETFSRRFTNNTVALASGTARLSYFACEEDDFTPTKIRCWVGTAAGATPTLARMGIWLVNADNSLTLKTACANNTALFSAVGEASATLTTAYTLVPGLRYAAGALIVTAASAPNIVGCIPTGISTMFGSAYTPRLAANYSGLSDLGDLAAPTSGNDATAQLWFAATLA